MKKIVKIIAFILAALSLAAYGYIYSQKPLIKETAIIEPRDAIMYFIQQGQGVEGSAVSVYPLVSGEIISVPVKEGEYIAQGDVICVVDTANMQMQISKSQTVIQAHNAQKKDLDLNESKQKVSLSASKSDLMAQLEALYARNASKSLSSQEQISLQESVVKQLQSNLEWSENNLNSATILYEAQAIPQQEYDHALKQFEDAKKALEQGELTLTTINSQADSTIGSDEYFSAMEASIKAQIEGIDNNLNSSYTSALEEYYDALISAEALNIADYKRQIESSVIKAPVSGKLEVLGVKDSNIVMPGVPAAVIRPDNETVVEVYVLTKDITSIYLGQPVELIFRARDKDIVIPAEVSEIGDKAEEKISALGVAEKKIKVTVKIPQDTIIKDGYDVDVKFTYYNQKEKMIVPKTALFKAQGKDMIWVVEDGILSQAEVVTGVELRGEVVIESGINFATVIIKDANDAQLTSGAKIQLAQETLEE